MKFKIGDIVTIKDSEIGVTWYHTNDMTIINNVKTLLYVDYDWGDGNGNTIDESYVELSKTQIRKLKLDSL